MTVTFLSFFRRHFFWLLILAAAIVIAGVYELGRSSVYRAHPELASAEQATAILAKVGELIQLPKEQPTMATIDDAASAKKAQPFLVNAENGDILIVYQNAQQAIVYRPSTNKLIAVGPVNNSAPQKVSPQAELVPATETASSTENATTTKSKR